MSRPDRSDAHLPPEEEARMEEEARHYFEGVAPKRHTKPQRSEYSATYTDALQPSSQDDDDHIPELDKFRDLESLHDKLVCEGSQAVDEYVETEYYKDLNCVDKQHHTTGTGFITVEKSSGGGGEECLDLSTTGCACHASCKSNPATNEWIPSADTVIPTSGKPKRSDL